MRPLDPSELLQVWERGVDAAPAQAILPLLAAACPELGAAGPARLTIGERDALLLSQREWLFGPYLEASETCPHCGERVEFTLTVDDLRTVPAVSDASELGQAKTQAVTADGYQVEFRSPSLGDIERATSPAELLELCVTGATRAGETAVVAELPEAVIEAVDRAMAAADPQGVIRLAPTCPACEREWLAVFDVAAYLWEELHTWAQRTLLEIHQLAGAYGWGEAEILALSPARRQIYLAMIGATE